MKPLALIATLSILLGYVALMRVDPNWGLLQPRGGMVMLGLSLAFANAAIHFAGRPGLAPGTRFELAAAGWIWLAVQGGGLAWIYSQAAAG